MKSRYCRCGSTTVQRCYQNMEEPTHVTGKAAPGFRPVWMCASCGYVMEKCKPVWKAPTKLSTWWFRKFEYKKWSKSFENP